ncbi:MAG: CDP-alcohol phosphatidyltransferase family protein [Myxococcaceae bacterium]
MLASELCVTLAQRMPGNLPSLVALAMLAGAFLVAFGAFALKTALSGRPQSKRVTQQGSNSLLGSYFLEYGLWVFGPVVRACVRLGVRPDTLSWTSLVFHFGAAVALAQGAFGLGGSLLVVGAMCDSLDGGVARERGLASDAGEVLDASVDRWAEMAVFVGLAYYYRNDSVGFLLAAAALAGAVMVSYARAKGEAMGVEARMGLMQRHERAAYLCLSTVLSPLLAWWWEPAAAHPRYPLVLAALALIAVLANATAIQRTAFVRSELRKRGR